MVRRSSLLSNSLFLHIFNFTSKNIDGYNKVKEKSESVGYYQTTECYQTENEVIACLYNKLLDIGVKFSIRIYDINFNYYSNEEIETIYENTFIKIFHIKGEIGACLYFPKDSNIPRLQLKYIENYNLYNQFNFDYIELNGDGQYSLKNEIFFFRWN